MIFPHSDKRVLHLAHECDLCALFPHLQEIRDAWQIARTGERARGQQTTCPSEQRGDTVNIFGGTRRVKYGSIR